MATKIYCKACTPFNPCPEGHKEVIQLLLDLDEREHLPPCAEFMDGRRLTRKLGFRPTAPKATLYRAMAEQLSLNLKVELLKREFAKKMGRQ